MRQQGRLVTILAAVLLASCSGGGGGIPAAPAPTASPRVQPSSVASASPSPVAKPTASAAPTPTPSASAGTSGASAGKIYYHFDPPVTSTAGLTESLDLAGDNYTDLIGSNFIAGAMLSRTIGETFPGVQFDRDYLYGTMFGQLLQENIETSSYAAGSNLIDPSPDQAAVMGVGQGGPYQINNYDVDLFAGGYTPQGFAMLNYVAVQKNIGFTFSQATAQFGEPTPASFNNKYYGPMLAAYFHLNDLRALNALGQTTYSPTPAFNACLANLKSVPNAPLDVLLNYAYNQGYYGGLLAQSTALCASNVSAFVAQANGYANAAGDGYHAYPYQVRFYLDELYNRSTIAPQTANHVVMNVKALGMVFANAMSTLSYAQGGQSISISSATALSAFDAAAQQSGASTTLDVSNPTQRAVLFGVLDQAIANLERAVGIEFSQVTLAQLS